jgi:hypothetical protein
MAVLVLTAPFVMAVVAAVLAILYTGLFLTHR